MLNRPRKTLSSIKKYLLKQQKDIKERLSSLDKEDPTMADNIAEASEAGTESWMAEVHGRITTLKNDLLELSKRITKSLINLKRGTYGICESCGKKIEVKRLEALPTATLCMSCSRKTPKKR